MADKQNSGKKPVDYGEVLVEALKRTPGNILGGGVDVANLLLGLVTGKGLEGFVKTPAGGSEQINKAFGMGQGQNPVQQAAEAVMSMASPGGMAKAIIVPAMLLKRPEQIRDATKLIKQGKESEAWQKHGIYVDPLDLEPKTYVNAATARINPAAIGSRSSPDKDKFLVRTYPSNVTKDGTNYELASKLFAAEYPKLGQILDYPEAYKLFPELQEIPVGNLFGGWKEASYNPQTDLMRLGATDSLQDFISMILHETQHAVQKNAEFIPGGNPSQFYSSPEAKLLIEDALKPLRKLTSTAQEGTYKLPAEREAMRSIINLIAPIQKPLENAAIQANKNYMSLGGETEARVVEAALANPALFQTKSPLQIQIENLQNSYGKDAARFAVSDTGVAGDKLVDQAPTVQDSLRLLEDPGLQQTLDQITKYLQSRLPAKP